MQPGRVWCAVDQLGFVCLPFVFVCELALGSYSTHLNRRLLCAGMVRLQLGRDVSEGTAGCPALVR